MRGMTMYKGYVIIGIGGHARVLLEAMKLNRYNILGFTALQSEPNERIMGIPILGKDDIIYNYDSGSIFLVNGIGSVKVSTKRMRIYERFTGAGYRFGIVVHPSAVVSKSALIDDGAQIMAGAIIQTACQIGKNTIINTGASIDHDSLVGNHVHVAPGVIISGGCTIGDNSHLGTGAIVVQGIKIGANAMIGAGSVVVKDVPDGAQVRGNPARLVGE